MSRLGLILLAWTMTAATAAAQDELSSEPIPRQFTPVQERAAAEARARQARLQNRQAVGINRGRPAVHLMDISQSRSFPPVDLGINLKSASTIRR